jgi:hypothetical protein
MQRLQTPDVQVMQVLLRQMRDLLMLSLSTAMQSVLLLPVRAVLMQLQNDKPFLINFF